MPAQPIRKLPDEPPEKRRLRVLPEDQLGHCTVCGAGFREYTGCEMPDCNWVREIPDTPD